MNHPLCWKKKRDAAMLARRRMVLPPSCRSIFESSLVVDALVRRSGAWLGRPPRRKPARQIATKDTKLNAYPRIVGVRPRSSERSLLELLTCYLLLTATRALYFFSVCPPPNCFAIAGRATQFSRRKVCWSCSWRDRKPFARELWAAPRACLTPTLPGRGGGGQGACNRLQHRAIRHESRPLRCPGTKPLY